MHSNSRIVLPSVGHGYVTELGTEISGISVGDKNINVGTIILCMFSLSLTLCQIIIVHFNEHRGAKFMLSSQQSLS